MVMVISDQRNATCFKDIVNTECVDPRRDVLGFPVSITKADCCCTNGAGWGQGPCEVCPEPGDGVIIMRDSTRALDL